MNNQTKINQYITAPELRVIDADGQNLGVLSREAALKLAAEQGLDLIEVTASAQPPIARIMSFDKYRYEQTKKLKKQQAHQKSKELKQVQIGIGTAANDLNIKVRKVEEFLNAGHPVVIMLVLRGREKGNRDWAKFKLGEFLKLITIEHQIVMDPRFSMRGLAVQIIKK